MLLPVYLSSWSAVSLSTMAEMFSIFLLILPVSGGLHNILDTTFLDVTLEYVE